MSIASNVGSSRWAWLLPLLLLQTGCPQKHGAQVVSVGIPATDSDVALDGTGRGAVLFSSRIPEDKAERGDLYEVDYDPITGFGAPQGFFTGVASYSPRIVLARSGIDHALWLANVLVTETRDEGHVYASADRLDGVPYAAVELDQGPVAPGELDLATDAAGNAIAVWQHSGSIVVSQSPAGLPFGPAVPIFTAVFGGAEASTPRVAVNANGDGVLVYVVHETAGDDSILAHRFAAGSALGALEILDVAAPAGPPSPAVAEDGTRLVTWRKVPSGGGARIVARRDVGSAGWGAEESVHSTYFSVEHLLAAFDRATTATIGWVEAGTPYYSRSVAGGNFGAAEDFGLYGDLGTELRFAVEPAGRVTFVKTSGTSSGPHNDAIAVRFVEPRGRGPSGFLSDSTGALEHARAVRVAADGSGTTLASRIMGDAVLAYAWLDPRAEFSVDPAKPTVGVTASFFGASSRGRSTATQLSQWQWDFDGDGTFDGDLPTVGHVFATAGRRPVRLRVTDTWGDHGEMTVDVDVLPPGGGGGGGGGPPWLLTVTMRGSGHVTSYAPGIDCPTDCDELYGDDAFVYLTPTADPGFVFDHWEADPAFASPDLDHGVNGCEFRMHFDRTVTAVFVVQ